MVVFTGVYEESREMIRTSGGFLWAR